MAQRLRRGASDRGGGATMAATGPRSASALSLFLLALVAAPASAARMKSEDSEAVPWRKAAAAGALAAHALSGRVAAAEPGVAPSADFEGGEEVDRRPEAGLGEEAAAGAPSGDSSAASVAELRRLDDEAFQRIEARLREDLGRHGLSDEAVVKKLMTHMRSRGANLLFAKRLDLDLQHGGLDRLERSEAVSTWSRHSAEPAFEQFVVRSEDGSPGFILWRFFAREQRSQEEVRGLQNLLKSVNIQRWKSTFLRQIAQSHTAEHLAEDRDGEVMLLFSPVIGTLREYLSEHLGGHKELELSQREFFFSRAIGLIQDLRRFRIAHNSAITLDTLLVVKHPDGLDLVLCPSILNTELRVGSGAERLWSWLTESELPEGTIKMSESLDADFRQLGGVLKHLFDGPWADDVAREINTLNAFGEALEAGAFSGMAEPVQHYMDIASKFGRDDISAEAWEALRSKYLLKADAARGEAAQKRRDGAEDEPVDEDQ